MLTLLTLLDVGPSMRFIYIQAYKISFLHIYLSFLLFFFNISSFFLIL